jgi:Family of unknown function (DUF5681)
MLNHSIRGRGRPWQKGQSGNPNGRPRRGNTFTDALRAAGTPQELADLAWKAARGGEPWAITLIFGRPEALPTELKHSQRGGYQHDHLQSSCQ